MRTLLVALSFLLLAGSAFAQDIAGTWYGAISVQGTQLHLVFHISKTGDVYATTMDSPDQGANGLPTDKTTVTGNNVAIAAARMGLTYTGTYNVAANKIDGHMAQGGMNLPLILTTTKDATGAAPTPQVARPQDPKDFPYKQEEVAFTNPKEGNTLAGTLTLPADDKATKIVVLITGSGPQNRDEEIKAFNHRPFLVWSDWLTRNGIAVLRYDDRGIGKSTGSFGKATSADFADDVTAAITYIRSRPDLKRLEIGLMGHSEGGMIAPMVASTNKAVQFIVLLAGPGAPIAQLEVEQNADQLRLKVAPADAIALSEAMNKKIYATIGENKDLSTAELKVKIDTVMYQALRQQPAAVLNGQNIDDIVRSTSTMALNPWFRYFITFDPGVYLRKVHCPVLALNGTLDMQVRSTTNLTAIKKALEQAGNTKYEIVPLTGLNHMLQKATTGSVDEYSQIEETVDPVALQKVSTWITQL